MSPQHAMIHEADTAPACPGRGRCHNTCWCPNCDATEDGPCDVRARGERCDRHPSAATLRKELTACKHDLKCIEEGVAEADRRARIAEAAAIGTRAKHRTKVREQETLAQAYEDAHRRLAAAVADEGGGR